MYKLFATWINNENLTPESITEFYEFVYNMYDRVETGLVGKAN